MLDSSHVPQIAILPTASEVVFVASTSIKIDRIKVYLLSESIAEQSKMVDCLRRGRDKMFLLSTFEILPVGFFAGIITDPYFINLCSEYS